MTANAMEFPDASPWCHSLHWLCAGVTGAEFPSEGGRACYEYLPVSERALETVICIVMTYCQFKWAYAKLPLATGKDDLTLSPKVAQWRSFVLLAYALIFGIEIGFKIASRQLIYLLNPCHITTSIQLFLLAVPPKAFARTLFRIHCNLLSGAFLAIVFPVTGSRQLPFEVQVYWIQHIMMLAVPIYLLCLGGPFTLEPISDLSLCIGTLSVMFLYHFIILQAVGMVLEVNLNNMLCPAPSDPFYGPHYRKYAMVHQSLIYRDVMPTSPWFVSFFTENETVEIIPRVAHGPIFLMGGKIGPFEPTISATVPLWVAMMMRQRHLCRITCPPWMTVETFQRIKEEEKSVANFTKLPGGEMLSIANRILDVENTVPQADELRSLLRDIEMNRQNKIQASVELLIKRSGSHAKLDNLTLQEINALRPSVTHSLNFLHRLHDAVVAPDNLSSTILSADISMSQS